MMGYGSSGGLDCLLICSFNGKAWKEDAYKQNQTKKRNPTESTTPFLIYGCLFTVCLARESPSSGTSTRGYDLKAEKPGSTHYESSLLIILHWHQQGPSKRKEKKKQNQIFKTCFSNGLNLALFLN